MFYINTRYGGQTETIDEFETRKEAREMLTEYRLAAPVMGYYLSIRCTREWRETA